MANTQIKEQEVTAGTVTDDQIRRLYNAGHINHSEWANALLHRHSPLGRHARAECARILNARWEGK